MPLKFCANLSMLFQENKSLLGRYDAAKRAGFKAVECAFPYEFPVKELAKVKNESGLEQVLINAHPGNWSKGERGLAALPGREREFEESIRQAIDYALKLNCKRIHVMSGVTMTNMPENLDVFTHNMRLAADLFEKNDLTGLIEPINPNSVPHYFLNTYQKALATVDAINSDHLKLQLDIFHLQQICGNLTKNIEMYLPRVGHIQIAQVPHRHEPDTQGEIDYKYVLSMLDKLNYSGWIGLEYIPKAGTIEGLSWIREYGYSV